MNELKIFENKEFGSIRTVQLNNETYFVDSLDVFYFESVDNRTFLYTADDVMEVKLRLYELGRAA